jgi:radical SAM superfamily enzyme YgiQ (UPF0313 family)
MRVLLVIPTTLYGTCYPSYFSNTDFPVGFAYLASALRAAGHEAFGLNPNNDPCFPSAYTMLNDKLVRAIGDSHPGLIGLGGLCTDYLFIKDAIKICRKHAPDIPIVCGGGIINHDAPFIFKNLKPDFCIVGEGEEALVQLANLIESGTRRYQDIPNLGYWLNGSAAFTLQKVNYPSIDSRPFPDYEPFGIREMLDNHGHAARYLYRYTRKDPRPMTVVTARGCPFNCTFCVHQRGPKYRARSIGNIMRELEEMYSRYRFNVLIVLDELFAVNSARLREFCESIIRRKDTLGWDFDWCFQTHASASFALDDLKLARDAGCYYFSYGLESASPLVLESMNKKTKPSYIAKAVDFAHKAKIGFGGSFIFGDPAETTETIVETITFFREHLQDDHVWLGPIKPYPGSKLYEDCIKRGIIKDPIDVYEWGGRRIYNMTSIPDALWTSWISMLATLDESLSWARTTYAESYTCEPGTCINKIGGRTGKILINYIVKCPHCRQEVNQNEVLENANDNHLKGFIKKIMSVYKSESGIYDFTKHHALPFLRRKISSLRFKEKHAILHLLEEIEDKGGGSRWVFTTGCPHCNRRFRVKIKE